MAKFAKGDPVKQIVLPISGTVAGFQVDQETGDVLVLVQWIEDDVEHSRYFTQDEIEPTASS